MKNLTGNLIIDFHTNFWVAIFSNFLEVASRLLAEGLHWGRGFPTYWVLPRVSTSPRAREDKSTPYLTHNDPFYYFCTLHINTYLHGRLYTFQCCTTALAVCCAANQTIIVSKALISDYTHAYSHSLVKLFITPIAFLEPVSFLINNFPILLAQPIIPIELAVYYMNFHLNRPLLPKHSTRRTMHSTYFKIKTSIYLFKASIALDSSANMFVFSWSMVSYHHSNTQQLCAPVFHSCGTSPWTSPMRNPAPLAHIFLYLAT